jgi:hypothetical protein
VLWIGWYALTNVFLLRKFYLIESPDRPPPSTACLLDFSGSPIHCQQGRSMERMSGSTTISIILYTTLSLPLSFHSTRSLQSFRSLFLEMNQATGMQGFLLSVEPPVYAIRTSMSPATLSAFPWKLKSIKCWTGAHPSCSNTESLFKAYIMAILDVSGRTIMRSNTSWILGLR